MSQKETSDILKNDFLRFAALFSRNVKTEAESEHSLEDYTLYADLANQHRLSAQAFKSLKELHLKVSSNEFNELKKRSEKNKLKMLRFTAEILSINRVFELKQTQVIWLKGPIGAYQIYGDYTAKESRDIDVLVNEKDIEKSLQLLIKEGYRLVYPYLNLNWKQKKYFKRVNNQLALFHPQKKIQLEVHWRLFANRYLLPYQFEEPYSQKETVKIGGQTVNGLGEVHLFIYLCVHGAKHAWSKLYWLLEVYYLAESLKQKAKSFYLKGKSKKLKNEIVNEAKRMGVERLVHQAFTLLEKVFDHKIGFDFQTDPVTSILVNNSLKAIEATTNDESFDKIKSYEKNCRMKLRDDLNYKRAEKKLLSVNDFVTFPLPSFLFFLYYPLRPFIFAWRRLTKKKKH